MFNNKLFSMNLFRFQQLESYQRGSLAAIRWAVGLSLANYVSLVN